MKTEVVMYRKMGEFDILQRSKTGMFNATTLLKQWNDKDGNSRIKKINDFTRLSKTEEFIQTIMNKEGKALKSVLINARGKNGGTWMHPLLFIDFAMWLNPSFKYEVLKFVHDQLLDFRNDAGDQYKELAAAMKKLPDPNYIKMAQSLNYVVFNNHERDKRNKGTEQQLNDLNYLQRKMSDLINDGVIQNFQEYLKMMRLEWSKRYAKVLA